MVKANDFRGTCANNKEVKALVCGHNGY